MKLVIKNKRDENGMSEGNSIEGYDVTFAHSVLSQNILISSFFWGAFKGQAKNLERVDEAIARLNEIKRFLVENPDFTVGNIEVEEEIEHD